VRQKKERDFQDPWVEIKGQNQGGGGEIEKMPLFTSRDLG